MPSPRTEPRHWLAGWRVDRRRLGDLAQRLNVRLIASLVVVAFVGLAVSGIAISQILPGYFEEQSQTRARTAAASTAVLLQQTLLTSAEGNPRVAVDPALRNRRLAGFATYAADLFDATVTIRSPLRRVIATADPPNPDDLAASGLLRDPTVAPIEARVLIPFEGGQQVEYIVEVSQPYSTREATLARIRETLISAGVLALVVSIVTGLVAARTITVPIGRLRGVARRITQGHLDERVPQSDILEIDELGHQFNVMADRLAGTLRMLEADRDRLREFVADVSHELRTPIAALRMYNELQREGAVDEATRAEFIQRSTEQIRRLEWLSTNLLDLSRIDAGIFPLDVRRGDLRDPLQAVVQALSEVAVARGIGLESSAPAHPVELRFDRERVVQLLTNLVGNSLKFTPRGGSVSVTLSETDDDAIIEVRDTGAGIPADELPRIFERFYRGTNTGDARASGSGLGLAIVRSIVEMHGGEIDVQSVVGEGTAFHVRLPRASSEASVPATDDDGKVNESLRGGHRAQTAPS